ncbi:MAG TPA: methionine--tRNA ligase subunit beta, partial [Euryarchaeota archaeon]|nr:methionine--tRNA ligase subunit beta [Euryarchaeota archaeon]
ANGEYNLPYNVAGLQYLNYEGGKISKSRGFGIFCENLPQTELSSDLWRFYLTYLIPETDDTEWKWKEFRERVNNELVANLGNFIHRTMSFIQRYFDGRVPCAKLEEEDKKVIEEANRIKEEYKGLIWNIHLRDGMRKLLELSDICNKYFQKQEPWKSIKENPERARASLYTCANLCYYLAVLMHPYLPKASREVFKILGTEQGKLEDVGELKVEGEQKIGRVKILFQKIDNKTIEKVKKITSKVTRFDEMFAEEKLINYEDFSKLDIRVAKVLKAEKVKDADKLLKLRVSLGSEERQIIAGLAEHYTIEELEGKKVILLVNLKPRKIRGEVSQGMLLAGISEDKVSLLIPDRDIKLGSNIS